MTWKDIKLSQYYKIKDLLKEPDEYTTYNLLDVLFDIDSVNMPITKLSKYAGAIDFIKDEVPTVNLKDKYEINGTTYCSNLNLTKVTAAQFVDYQNYIGTEKFEDYLSVFFIPEGHKYNDGYDIEQVKKDMLELDFPTVKSIGFFFTVQFEKLQTTTLSYLRKELKKMKLGKEQTKKVVEMIDQLEAVNSELYLSF